MKKQSIIYGFMIIAGSLLFSSCSTKETANSETDKVPGNSTTYIKSGTPADTTMKISKAAETKKATGLSEKDEKEENEKEDKD